MVSGKGVITDSSCFITEWLVRRKTFMKSKLQRIFINLASIMPMNIGVKLYKLCGIQIGEGTTISRGFYLDRSEGLSIGHNCFLNYGISCICGSEQGGGTISIGNNVYLGPNVSMCCASHDIGKHHQRAGKNIYGPIVISDGCWIGMHAKILANVTIAEGCVIAAGAVVTKSTTPDGLYAGVPAKRIKDLA